MPERNPPVKGNVQSSHLSDISVPPLLTTAIPIREEFRCRRFLFVYHDLRAFTSSWLPLPIFLVYRVLVFLYIVSWLILHIIEREEEMGVKWLIFISNISFCILTISFGSMATLCLIYTIFYYSDSQRLLKFFPKKDFPVRRIYKQNNIPWAVKIVWGLYIIAGTAAFVVFLGYWAFLYSPCNDSEQSMSSGNWSSSDGPEESCSDLDVHAVHFHGVNLLLVFLDIILSRIPYQILHIFYPLLLSVPYGIFTLIYWRAGGTDPESNEYIYSVLDYENDSISFVLLVIVVLSPTLFHFFLFLLARFRDVTFQKIKFCYWDIKKLSYQDNPQNHQVLNGVESEEITKV